MLLPYPPSFPQYEREWFQYGGRDVHNFPLAVKSKVHDKIPLMFKVIRSTRCVLMPLEAAKTCASFAHRARQHKPYRKRLLGVV